MQNQLTRILSTSTILPPQFIQSLHNNQYQLTQLQQFQQILTQKNNQVQQLHLLINEQLNRTIQENNILKNVMKNVNGFVGEVKGYMDQVRGKMKEYNFSMGRDMKIIVGKIVQQVKSVYQRKYRKQCQQFKQTYKLKHQQKQKSSQKSEISIQTQQLQLPIHITQQIQHLHSQIKILKQQKQKLQNKINSLTQQQYINHQQSASPDDYSSTQSQQNNKKLSIIYSHFATQFKQIQQKKYIGQIINNKKHGFGRCQYSQQFVYEGRFIKGMRDGIGQMRYQDYIIYKGQWKKDKIHGKGCLYFINEQRQAYGQEENGNGIQKYCGNFKNGKIQGYGTIYYHSGQKVRGYFQQGKLISSALIQHKQQNILQYGQFKQPNLLPQYVYNIPISMTN